MALALDTWVQSPTFNPADPTQKKIEKYVGIPGQYATFYFNRVPNPGALKGPMLRIRERVADATRLRGLGMPALFSLGGILLYSAIAAGGYLFATKTKPGRKLVSKAKRLIPHRRRR